MKKGAISIFLAAILLIGMLPSSALSTGVTSENEPVYLGTEAELQSTFATMFDENGLRKVSIGYHGNTHNHDNDFTYNLKYGFVNKYGNFVAQPIYDEIKYYVTYDLKINGEYGEFITPKYFVGGYTQAVRDGKMGLLNTRGEEVVPCQYDFVSLPSEGMVRVLNKVPNSTNWYLGYWNIEQNREVVAPNT